MTKDQFIEAVAVMIENMDIDDFPWGATSFCGDGEDVMWMVRDFLEDFKSKHNI